MKKLLSLLISLGILLMIFLLAFFGTDIVMKIVVGHRNEVRVPDLGNMHFDVARKKCKKINLYLKEIELVNNEDIEKNYIISQNPNPAIMTKKNRTIEVVVSNGPAMIRTPFLENLTVLQAKLKLENTGLHLGEKIYRYSEEVTKDKVIYSQPMAEELIAKNSEVKIVVSLGKFSNSSSSKDKWKNMLEDQ